MIRKLLFVLMYVLSIVSYGNSQDFSMFDCEITVDNRVLENPFNGGVNTPHISSTDLNFDGMKDLIIFDKVGDVVIPLINTGSFENASYSYDLSFVKYFPKVRGLMILRDFNNDGLEDIFTFSEVGSALDLYEAYRVGYHIEYKKFTFNVEGYNGLFYKYGGNNIEIYVAPGDLPGIIDIDDDGDLDILSFLAGGGEVINYFKNVSVEKGYGTDTLIFELADDCWGKLRRSLSKNAVILSPSMNDCPDNFRAKNNSKDRHAGAATFCLYDDNGDGLIDVLLGDDQTGRLIYLKNGGTIDNAWIVAQDTMYPSYNVPFDLPVFASAFYIDIDNDNKRDLLASTNDTGSSKNYDNIWFYKNIGTDDSPLFEFQLESVLVDEILDFGGYSAPSFVDENGDGLLDIVVGNYGYREGVGEVKPKLALFRNIGTANIPSFELIDDDYLAFSSFQSDYSEHLAPTFGDMDNDDDMDLIIGDSKGKLYYLENIAGDNASLSFAPAIYPYMSIKVSALAKPSIVDVNEDGMMDLVIGEKNSNQLNETIGSLNYFQNQGTDSEPFFNNDETMAPNYPVLGGVNMRVGDYVFPTTAPCFVPIENDYMLFSGCAAGIIKLYSGVLDDKYNFVTRSEEFGGLDLGEVSTIAVADIDNDGYYEMLIGNKRGGLNFINSPVKITGDISEVSNIDKISDVYVYPNPVKDIVYFSENINEYSTIKISSVSGEILIAKKVANLKNNIDISNLIKGIYFVQLKSKNGGVVTKKIVKM